MEQESKKPPNPKYCVPRGSLWVWVLFGCFFFRHRLLSEDIEGTVWDCGQNQGFVG